MKQKLLPIVCLILFIAVASLQAQRGATGTSPTQTPPKPGATVPTAKQPDDPARTITQPANTYLRATMGTSRVEVTIDGAYGVFADFENLASVPVTLFEHETQLVIQPEVTGSGVCTWRVPGWFPTEYESRTLDLKPEVVAANAEPSVRAGAAGRQIRIRPQEHYTVFWSLGRKSTTALPPAPEVPARPRPATVQASQSKDDNFATQPPAQANDPCATEGTLWWWLNFMPGDYLFTIDAKFYLPDAANEMDYHTFTQTTKLGLKIPQHFAMWAAAFGALLAYFVVLSGPSNKTNPPTNSDETKNDPIQNRIAVWCRDGASAALLGAAMTIIASRLANTEFPIKVSVNDIWGAVTVGFVGYFTGNKIIDKLRQTATGPSTVTTTERTTGTKTGLSGTTTGTTGATGTTP